MEQTLVSFKVIIVISLMLLTHIAYADNGVAKSTNPPQDKALSTPIEKNINTNSNSDLSNHATIGAMNYLQMLFGLFFIVAFIFAIAWLIKRMGTLSPGHSNNLKIVAGLSVGQREKIIVLQVMDEQLIVGVTQSNIQLISKLDRNIPIQQAISVNGFQDKLVSAMQGLKKKAAGDK